MAEHDIYPSRQALVKCPSLPGEEGDAVRLVLAEMQALGFDKVWMDENGSAVGVISGALSGPTLLLDAHCDTVGIAPSVPWQHDPFGAEIADDMIFGRGAADMKGALAGDDLRRGRRCPGGFWQDRSHQRHGAGRESRRGPRSGR